MFVAGLLEEWRVRAEKLAMHEIRLALRTIGAYIDRQHLALEGLSVTMLIRICLAIKRSGTHPLKSIGSHCFSLLLPVEAILVIWFGFEGLSTKETCVWKLRVGVWCVEVGRLRN